MSDQVPVALAARVLGLSERNLRVMISAGKISDASRAGEPAAVLASDVERVLHERRMEAARRHSDAGAFAAQVRRSIWPDEELDWVTLADGRREIADTIQAFHIQKQPKGREVLRTLNPDAVALFGRAAVEVAAMPRDTWAQHCRWCFADADAKALGGLRPVDSPAYRTLLGADPCALDRARWKTEADERRAADKRLAQQLALQERVAAQSTARQEVAAATQALRGAETRRTAALRTLASVDPSAAARAASAAPQRVSTAAARTVTTSARSRIPAWCTCDSEELCSRHRLMLAQKGDIRRSRPRR